MNDSEARRYNMDQSNSLWHTVICIPEWIEKLILTNFEIDLILFLYPYKEHMLTKYHSSY